MGKILQFAPHTEACEQLVKQETSQSCSAASERQRLRAQFYIYRAASILNKLDERDERISWLLEDCAERLREAW